MATSRQLREEIAAGKWDGALAALYGAAALPRQRQRYGAALAQFELYFGPGRQVRLYSAPGRAELGGNHTDPARLWSGGSRDAGSGGRGLAQR